jgi:uncharacterized circularly permuted ATP-grasp superfamily protein/uncharacterized alpha-E superfamily protein
MAHVADPRASVLADYCPIAGVWDELVDTEGAIRTHWRPFVEALAELGLDELKQRADGVARRLRESGVYYRAYDRDTDQAWPLSAMPIVIAADDWRHIEAGVIQRARLMERALRDLYGPRTLIAEGDVPAAVIAGSPDFLRPMAGAPAQRHLHFYAVDLGRAPDGRWWVLNDRAQAPSGAGYALGNRIALSRTLPESMHELDVQRLAAFFQTFRSTLTARSAPDSAGVCLLTPGPYNETYYEHAYLARYLGFHLVEGEDLAVRNGRVYLRTVAGLKKVDTLLRRLDADFVDPLELNPASRLGAPGLAHAARLGNVTFANALGSGLVESRALMSFWPRLAQKLLGEDLLLPNIATWWCGDDAARALVRSRFDELAIAPAFTSDRPGLFNIGAARGAALSIKDREAVLARMERRGGDFVGQELVTLSTSPVLTPTGFEPRPFQLRVFLAAVGDDGWVVMPGGFARVSSRSDPLAISMQRGGMSADAWVLADGPRVFSSLLPSANSLDLRRAAGVLTTRTAENMFWLGRYLERADASLRLVRALATRAHERDVEASVVSDKLISLLETWGALAELDAGEERPAGDAAAEAMHAQDLFGAPPVLVRRALNAASAIRDLLAPDAWRMIKALDRQMAEPGDGTVAGTLDLAERALRELAAFSGYAHENMTRSTGWTMLEIGRRIERGLAVARFSAQFGARGAPPASLDALLELGDSQITYARRYFVTASPAAVADLLIFDEDNPRSCAFQAQHLRRLLEQLPESAHADAASALRRSIVLLEALMASRTPAAVDDVFLEELDRAFLQVATAFLDNYLADQEGPA